MKQWTNDSMNQWTSEPVNQGSGRAMTPAINQPMNQWIDESITQWTSDAMNHLYNQLTREPTRTTKSMKHWLNYKRNRIHAWKSMNQWTQEWRDGWIDGWTGGWADCFPLLNYFFSGQPLRWGPFSISYFSSGPWFTWVSSALSWLPVGSFIVSATKVFSSQGCYFV